MTACWKTKQDTEKKNLSLSLFPISVLSCLLLPKTGLINFFHQIFISEFIYIKCLSPIGFSVKYYDIAILLSLILVCESSENKFKLQAFQIILSMDTIFCKLLLQIRRFTDSKSCMLLSYILINECQVEG